MIITHNIKMDLARNSIRASVDAVQGDKNGRQLKITLLANNTAWNIPGGAVAVIRYRRTDGTGGEYGSLSDGSAAYSIAGNVLTVTLAPQVCAEPGKVTLTVALMLGDVELNTFAVDLKVQYNPDIDAEDPEYEVEDPTLEDRVVVLEATCSRLIGEIAGMTQLTPEFANSIAECTDTSKLYVLPDGYIYAYVLHTEGDTTNYVPQAIDSDGSAYNGGIGYLTGYRVRSSGEVVAGDECCCTGYIPVKLGDVIRLRNIVLPKSGADNQGSYAINVSDSNFAVIGSIAMTNLGTGSYEVDSDNNVVTIYTVNLVGADGTNDCRSDAMAYIRISAKEITSSSSITINEYEGEVTTSYAWTNTGHAFVPADYEDRIIFLEKAVVGDMAVYGIVDSENNIILTGTLAAGEYTLKYRNEDSTEIDIGAFTME